MRAATDDDQTELPQQAVQCWAEKVVAETVSFRVKTGAWVFALAERSRAMRPYRVVAFARDALEPLAVENTYLSSDILD